MEQPVRHLFFDLDRTLWDFETSAIETFGEIFDHFELNPLGVPDKDLLLKVYNKHNERLWDEYRAGRLEKEVLRGLRFRVTLEEFGIDDPELAERIGHYYIEESPRKVNLFPHTHEVLTRLSAKYDLHIITNGFSEVQEVKMTCSGLTPYFKEVITSEEAGVKKPNPAIFYYALTKAGATVENSMMIGDDLEVDIYGARGTGMRQVLFDPGAVHNPLESTYYIRDLKELLSLL